LQNVEALLDSAHANVLHADVTRPVAGSQMRKAAPPGVYQDDSGEGPPSSAFPSNDTRPKIEIEDMPYGFRYAAVRRTLTAPDSRYVRATVFVMPFSCMTPISDAWGTMNINVPLDDEHTAFYAVRFSRQEPVDADLIRRQSGRMVGRDIDQNHRRMANASNKWLQDRRAMREGRSFSGLGSVVNEDAAMTEGMGRIVDRTREHLGASDRAIIRLRRMLLSALELQSRGQWIPDESEVRHVRAGDGVIDADQPWQLVMDAPETVLAPWQATK
jgi:phthalate 4,5-dioxygenase oxygenase subunit